MTHTYMLSVWIHFFLFDCECKCKTGTPVWGLGQGQGLNRDSRKPSSHQPAWAPITNTNNQGDRVPKVIYRQKRLQGNASEVWYKNIPHAATFPPYELSVVVRPLGQQFDFPPVEELVQGGERILGYGAFIRIAPHLQTHQSHSDVQGPVELRTA